MGFGVGCFVRLNFIRLALASSDTSEPCDAVVPVVWPMFALRSSWVIWRHRKWLLVGVWVWIVIAYDYAGANRTYVLPAFGEDVFIEP